MTAAPEIRACIEVRFVPGEFLRTYSVEEYEEDRERATDALYAGHIGYRWGKGAPGAEELTGDWTECPHARIRIADVVAYHAQMRPRLGLD
jgi:hypothetical protein